MARYLTTAEVAEIYRMSPETLRSWRYAGKGPQWFKLGVKKVLYDADVVEAWFREAQEPSPKKQLGWLAYAKGQRP